MSIYKNKYNVPSLEIIFEDGSSILVENESIKIDKRGPSYKVHLLPSANDRHSSHGPRIKVLIHGNEYRTYPMDRKSYSLTYAKEYAKERDIDRENAAILVAEFMGKEIVNYFYNANIENRNAIDIKLNALKRLSYEDRAYLIGRGRARFKIEG